MKYNLKTLFIILSYLLVNVEVGSSQTETNGEWLVRNRQQIVSRTNYYQSQILPPSVQPLTIFHRNEVDRIFSYFQNERPDLVFDYTPNGCTQRAQMMGQALNMNGFRVARIWLSTQRPHSLQVPSRLNPGETQHWDYHTAIVVSATPRPGQRAELFVIDPSVATRPLTVNEWTNMQTRHNPSMPYALSFSAHDQMTETAYDNAAERYFNQSERLGVSRESLLFGTSVDHLADYHVQMLNGAREYKRCTTCNLPTTEQLRQRGRR